MEMEKVEEVVIVGGGIAGLGTAVALRRVGIEALVLERSEGLRVSGTALTLAPNAWLALRALGVAHKLISRYAPFKKVIMTNVANGVVQEANLDGADSDGDGLRTIHRRALAEALAEELPANSIRYSSKIVSIEAQNQEPTSISTLHMADGTIIKAKVLIGCDGVHSVVARWLGLSAPVDAGRSGVVGLAKYEEGHGFNQQVYQFVDAGKRAGFVPLTDKELYWFYIGKSSYTGDEDIARNPKLIQRKVIEDFAKDFPPTYLDVVRHADTASMTWTNLKLRKPWDVILTRACKGTVTVAGDAMHPMTPDLGHGGCTALEDAVCLGRHIGESFLRHGGLVTREVALALDGYVKERRWRVAALIAGSYLSGWVQQQGSGWTKFLRDVIFYKLVFPKLTALVHYDCGKLPSSAQLEK